MGRSVGATLIDESLVVRSQAGDAAAIAELAGQARPLAQRYATRFFSDPGRAEDLAQTALMKAFSRVGDVRSPQAFHAWLLRITRNECLNELARQRHAQVPISTLDDQGASLEAPAGGEDDPEEALARTQLQALVRRVAAGLPEHYRRALTMRALEDRTYEEISAELEIPVTVARLWYCRARKRFRKAFVELVVSRRGVQGDCLEMGVDIAGLIEGTLGRNDRDRVHAHLSDCAVCRQTEDELRNTAFRMPTRAMLAGLGIYRAGLRLRRASGPARRAAAPVHRSAVRLVATGAGGVSLAAVSAMPAVAATPAVRTLHAVAAAASVPASGTSAAHAGTDAAAPAVTAPAAVLVTVSPDGVRLLALPASAATLLTALGSLQPVQLLGPAVHTATGTVRTATRTAKGAVTTLVGTGVTLLELTQQQSSTSSSPPPPPPPPSNPPTSPSTTAG